MVNEITWDEETLTNNEYTIPYTLDGDTLTVHDINGDGVFKK